MQYLRLDEAINIPGLPDMTGVDLSAPVEGGQPVPVIPDERTDYPPLWLGSAVINNARNIYARGQQRGNNPNSLIKIGESNTAGTVYMCTFNYGNYDLGRVSGLAAGGGSLQFDRIVLPLRLHRAQRLRRRQPARPDSGRLRRNVRRARRRSTAPTASTSRATR